MTVLSEKINLPKNTKKKALPPANSPLDMNRIATIILGGGQGTRLFPLTATRCKPAINFGGRYRLIDVPMSNALNSGCHKIFIITQFLSSSLHQHIFKTYHRDSFTGGYVELLPAEQKPKDCGWFQGTADAVRQNLEYFTEASADYFLILSGDQLYNINFQDMFRFALKTDADLIVASLPVHEQETKRMGILKIDKNQFVVDFCEKPQSKNLLEKLQIPKAFFSKCGVSENSDKNYLGSMGIYLFKREALLTLLRADQREDFGKHLIPTQVKKGNTATFIHPGYWEDIGTIESFYKANMALTASQPLFNCYDENKPIYTSPYNLPGPKIVNCLVKQSIICEGSLVEADEISHSILGPRSIIKNGSIIRNSYVMGNEFYQRPVQNTTLPEVMSIGENCIINKSIIDKHAHIGNGVQLINKNNLAHYDGENVFIRDEIIVVPRGASLPDGFVL
jgi:glucose-1-phosphate adenylyltransferase